MKKIEIIYEDEQIVVANKPAHILTIPDRFRDDVPNLYMQLFKEYGKIYTVHRLDKETSGVICFAKNETAHRDLSMQFQERKVEKQYQALIEGIPMEEGGTIEAYLMPSPRGKGKMVVNRDGKKAITHWSIAEKFSRHCLVNCQIETGRMHQIRVHLKHIGYPILCDALYGKSGEFFLSTLKGKKYRIGKNQEERPIISRTALHAHQLTVYHPTERKSITFTAKMPKDMHATLQQMRKLSAK